MARGDLPTASMKRVYRRSSRASASAARSELGVGKNQRAEPGDARAAGGRLPLRLSASQFTQLDPGRGLGHCRELPRARAQRARGRRRQGRTIRSSAAMAAVSPGGRHPAPCVVDHVVTRSTQSRAIYRRHRQRRTGPSSSGSLSALNAVPQGVDDGLLCRIEVKAYARVALRRLTKVCPGVSFQAGLGRGLGARSASGITVEPADIPIIMGMIAPGDRHHDIAAWFGLNQGRIADTQDGKYGPPRADPGLKLPPKGPPGLERRENCVRQSVRLLLVSRRWRWSGGMPSFRTRLNAMTPTKRSRPFVQDLAGRAAPTSGAVLWTPTFPRRTT